MQIHELNNFGGTLGSGTYLAVDNGTDTGKLSTQQLLAPTEARIDNIIAGDAPSAAEVTDARLGADGVTYTSLGTAIRSQVSDLKADLNNAVADGGMPINRSGIVNAYCSSTVGSTITFSSSSASKTYKKIIAVKKGHQYVIKVTASSSPASVNPRTSCVTDGSDVIRQIVEIGVQASQTFETVFTSITDGWFYLCIDKNTVSVEINGGMVFDNQVSTKKIESNVNDIASFNHNYFDFTQALVGKYLDGSVGSTYSANSNANYWAYLLEVEQNTTYILRRTDYRWLEIDANGIVLAQHGNSTPVGYLAVAPTKSATKYIGFSWTTVNPVNYMVLEPNVSFDDYIPYPNTNALNQQIVENSGLVTDTRLDVSKANSILNGFDVKENFFNPSTAIVGKFIAGDLGGALRAADNAGYAYNVIPVEYGKSYVLSRSDYARFEFNEDMICVNRFGDSTGIADFSYTPSRVDVKYVGVSWSWGAKNVDSYMATYQGVDRTQYISYPSVVSSNIPYGEKEIHIGADKDYTSIMAAFNAYKNDSDTKVFYIDSGVYDIYSELGGAAFLQTINVGDSYADVSTFVPENSKVIGIGSVTLLYQPDAEDIPIDNAVSCISPINVRGNVEIENITIICKNCRYAIHDETGTNSRYNNTKKIYRRVRATKNANDYVPTDSVISGQSFGCGFGSANEYLFEECYFKSNVTAFSMHNNPTTKAYQGSNITLRNCVIDTDATQSIRFGAVYSNYPMENVVNVCDSYIKSRVTVTRESAENGASNSFNLTLLNCSDIETLDEFQTHGWQSDYNIKVFNPI